MTPPPLPKHLIGISTKMYFDTPRTLTHLQSLLSLYPTPSSLPPNILLFYIPTHPLISPCSLLLQQNPSPQPDDPANPPQPHVLLGAQDSHHEDTGAFTGSVSPLVLHQLGCTIIELGHAERRAAPLNESDPLIALKAAAVVRNGMIPLICIGERNQSKSGIMSESVGIAVREVLPQVEVILDAVPGDTDVVFAYEPVWAIGKAEAAGADHVLGVVAAVRRCVEARGRKGAVRVLYGGSAGPGIWEGLKGGVDGLFLGRFGHDVENVRRVVEEVGRS
ncbi:hypothetical protein MMC30_002185 [Trapelia coarctata]|nr:hypothetical protein [Trapelia coarctata]